MVLFLFDLKYSIPYSNNFHSLNRWKQNYLSFWVGQFCLSPLWKLFYLKFQPLPSSVQALFQAFMHAFQSKVDWSWVTFIYFAYYLYRHVAHSLSSGPWRELGVDDVQVRHYIIAFANFLLFSCHTFIKIHCSHLRA